MTIEVLFSAMRTAGRRNPLTHCWRLDADGRTVTCLECETSFKLWRFAKRAKVAETLVALERCQIEQIRQRLAPDRSIMEDSPSPSPSMSLSPSWSNSVSLSPSPSMSITVSGRWRP